MSTPPPATQLAPRAPLSPSERATISAFRIQRRLWVLRLLTSPLLVLVVLALPFAVQADVRSGVDYDHPSIMLIQGSSFQLAIGLAGIGIATWATYLRRVTLATSALFAGVTGVVVCLIVASGPLAGMIHLPAVLELSLLVVPIMVVGILTGPRVIALVTLATVLFSVAVLILTPHAADVQATLAAPDGLLLFTVPVAVQVVTGIFWLAAAASNQSIVRELVDIRVAYAREKELERLKDQFISSVNHELRTPIMALEGYIALARELGARGDLARQDELLGRGAEAVSHLAEVVRSVLNVRRVEATGAPAPAVPCVLRSIVFDALKLLDPRETGANPRDLHIEIAADLAVLANEERVRQVLLNLLSNAAKYSPPGSGIEVAACVREPAPARGRGRVSRGAALVEVAVRDHGLGIPPDQAPLLFQRFVRLERDITSPVPGTGLGLAICRAYVEAMGGQIWVESSGEPGEGSTFRFTLPLARQATAAETSVASMAQRG